METMSNDGLPVVKMLHLGCDGPNVNKSVKKQLNDCVVKLGGKLLIDIGSCNLHDAQWFPCRSSEGGWGHGELKTSYPMFSLSSKVPISI